MADGRIDWRDANPHLPFGKHVGRPAREPKPEKPRGWNSTLAPGKRLSPVGKNEARREEVDGPQAEACRMLPCCICGAEPPSEPQHTPKRSLGGVDADTVPMCRDHHEEADNIEARHSRFWRRYKMDPETIKEAVRDWMAAGYPQGEKPFGGAR